MPSIIATQPEMSPISQGSVRYVECVVEFLMINLLHIIRHKYRGLVAPVLIYNGQRTAFPPPCISLCSPASGINCIAELSNVILTVIQIPKISAIKQVKRSNKN